MAHLADLTEYILITDPLLTREPLDEILAIMDGVEWRVPDDSHRTTYFRTCTTFPISAALTGGFLPPDRIDRAKRVDETLLAAAHTALRLYKTRWPVYTVADQGFDILRYETGQFIDVHVDDQTPRALSMSIALNDDYTGGEFRFWKEESSTFRVPMGSAIMFPPTFMFPHQILPVTSGTRYSMIAWFI